MIIIISPSKTKKFKEFIKYSKNLFPSKTEYLKGILSSMKKDELIKILKYKKIDEIDYLEETKNAAIYSYNGLVFKNLDAKNLINLDRLYILSAYYGILRATDGISNYRLDMTNNILNISLYKYWENIYNFFENEDYVLNLASKEYSKMINPKNMINFEFKTNVDGNYKILSTNSKILRGKFCKYILNNDIKDIELIKRISIDNYSFNNKLSTPNTFVFTDIK